MGGRPGGPGGQPTTRLGSLDLLVSSQQIVERDMIGLLLAFHFLPHSMIFWRSALVYLVPSVPTPTTGSRRPSVDSTSSNPARSPASPRSRCSRRPVRRFGEKRRVSSRGGSRARLGRTVLRESRRASGYGFHRRSPGGVRRILEFPDSGRPFGRRLRRTLVRGFPPASSTASRAVAHPHRRGRPSASTAGQLTVAPLRSVRPTQQTAHAPLAGSGLTTRGQLRSRLTPDLE